MLLKIKLRKKKLIIKKIKFINKYFLSIIKFISIMKKIFGINFYIGLQICRVFGLNYNIKIGYVDFLILKKIADFFISYLLVERGLRRFRNSLLIERKVNGCVLGIRLLNGLPIHGQRTHTNGKTVKKLFKFYQFQEE